jgi:beta-phosphoglucomutase-like phosphatase (HAD superfamily)
VSTESLSPVGPCADSFDMVIFDMDGVIFDTERLAITAWKEAGAHFGGRDVVDYIESVIEKRNKLA